MICKVPARPKRDCSQQPMRARTSLHFWPWLNMQTRILFLPKSYGFISPTISTDLQSKQKRIHAGPIWIAEKHNAVVERPSTQPRKPSAGGIAQHQRSWRKG